jgi:hypothetical protein
MQTREAGRQANLVHIASLLIISSPLLRCHFLHFVLSSPLVRCSRFVSSSHGHFVASVVGFGVQLTERLIVCRNPCHLLSAQVGRIDPQAQCQPRRASEDPGDFHARVELHHDGGQDCVVGQERGRQAQQRYCHCTLGFKSVRIGNVNGVF